MNKEKLKQLMEEEGYEEIYTDYKYINSGLKYSRIIFEKENQEIELCFKPKENHTSAITGMSAPDCTKGEFSEAPADAQTQKEKGCGKKVGIANGKEVFCGEFIYRRLQLCPECQEKEKPQETRIRNKKTLKEDFEKNISLNYNAGETEPKSITFYGKEFINQDYAENDDLRKDLEEFFGNNFYYEPTDEKIQWSWIEGVPPKKCSDRLKILIKKAIKKAREEK